SSRRRHTISKRDWSSDVCSSDLLGQLDQGRERGRGFRPEVAEGDGGLGARARAPDPQGVEQGGHRLLGPGADLAQREGGPLGPRSEERRVGKASATASVTWRLTK